MLWVTLNSEQNNEPQLERIEYTRHTLTGNVYGARMLFSLFTVNTKYAASV